MTREATNRLLEMIESGLLDRDAVILACVKYMSENDVADMCHANEFFLGEDEDEDEDEDGGEDEDTLRSGAFDVYLDDEWIDTVFANNTSIDEMRRSLINHDGYDSSIVVKFRE